MITNTMQQHTVPRDIGSQEFKLVGSMTLKQFTMLLSGCIVAYIFYLLPVHPFLKWPPALLSVFFGFAFAFMPIQERALDHWIVALVRAILAPSQRVWQQVGFVPEFLTLELHRAIGPVRPALAHDRTFLTAILRAIPQTPQTPLDLQESAYLGYIDTTLAKLTPTASRGAPSDTSLAKMAQGRTPIILDANTFASTINVAHEHVIKLPSFGSAVRVIPGLRNVRPRKLHVRTPTGAPLQPPSETPATQPSVFFVPKTTMRPAPPQSVSTSASVPVSLSPPATGIRRDTAEIGLLRTQNISLAEHIAQLQKELKTTHATPLPIPAPRQEIPFERKPKGARGRDIDAAQLVPLTPAVSPLPPRSATMNVAAAGDSPSIPQTIAVPAHATASPPLTNLPNAVNGVVKNRSGELLANVIIVIKDLHGVPLRALKTNRLGQFAIATPLQNGTYTLELEKEGFAFDIIQTTITGTAVAPIEIVAGA